jgi:hypothetical protein
MNDREVLVVDKHMTNWHDSPLMIVKSADPTVHEGASLKKMLNERGTFSQWLHIKIYDRMQW